MARLLLEVCKCVSVCLHVMRCLLFIWMSHDAPLQFYWLIYVLYCWYFGGAHSHMANSPGTSFLLWCEKTENNWKWFCFHYKQTVNAILWLFIRQFRWPIPRFFPLKCMQLMCVCARLFVLVFCVDVAHSTMCLY